MAVHKIDGVDGVVNYPKKFVTLWSDGAAIAKGDVVQISTATTYGIGLTVTQADNEDCQMVVGIAMEAAGTTAIPIKVQVAGHNDIAVANVDINQFDMVGADAADNGEMQCVGGTAGATVALSTTVQAFALCITAYTAGNADGAIFIYDHGFYG